MDGRIDQQAAARHPLDDGPGIDDDCREARFDDAGPSTACPTTIDEKWWTVVLTMPRSGNHAERTHLSSAKAGDSTTLISLGCGSRHLTLARQVTTSISEPVAEGEQLLVLGMERRDQLLDLMWTFKPRWA